MNTATLRIDIVSAEAGIFSGEALMVYATGELGDLGIAPGHTALLTALKPGNIRVILPDQTEELFYISSGMLEVQPYVVTVLADTAIRAQNLDEAAVLEAKDRAEKALADRSAEIDMAKATAELAEAMAQIQTIRRLKNRAIK